MDTLSDQIERYLKSRLRRASGGCIEVRRCDLAEHFSCVPSQINYVLETRFTTERGFFVESRRGGGGFIRITRSVVESPDRLEHGEFRRIGKAIGAAEAGRLLDSLVDARIIDRRQRALVAQVVNAETLRAEPLPSDVVRAVALRVCLTLLLQGS